MKNNKIFISLTLTAILLVVTALVLIGCSIEKKIRKLQVYSVLAEQHEYDIDGVSLDFKILANCDKAPYDKTNIDNIQIEASSNFKEELSIRDISKTSSELYKNEMFGIFLYQLKTRKGINAGYYKDAKLTFTLKNNDKITFKVGEFSIRNYENVTFSEDGELLHFTAHEHIPNLELPIIYRFSKVMYKFEYTTKPFIIKSINYKFGENILSENYTLQTQGKQNTLQITIPHRELLFEGINLEIVGVLDGKEITQVIPQKVGYLTVAEFLSSAGELCSEPISKNF